MASGSPHTSDEAAPLPADVQADPTSFAVVVEDANKEQFDALLRRAWELSSAEPLPKGTRADLQRILSEQGPSTIDSDNRRRDAHRVQERLGLELPEAGSDTNALMVGATCVARGYTRVLYGDHGPYFELLDCCVNWPLFRRHILKGPQRHYHEHHMTVAATAEYPTAIPVMVYDQFRGVGDEPNPPPGEWSCDNNRAAGYAPYVPGRLYLSADTVTIVAASVEPHSSE
jgi:hypothetical protein